MHSPSPSPSTADITVPWPRIEKFVGQLTHDIRNGLNALELQLTLIGEVSQEAETKEEVKRMRAALGDLTRLLQAVRTSAGTPNVHLFPYPAADLFEDLRARFEGRFTDAVKRADWSADLGPAAMNVDPELLLATFLELFANALNFSASGSRIAVRAEADVSTFTLHIEQALRVEPSEPVADWGKTPLLSSRRGAYGLGVFRGRRIVETLGGSLNFKYSAEAGTLTATVKLPLVAAGTVVE